MEMGAVWGCENINQTGAIEVRYELKASEAPTTDFFLSLSGVTTYHDGTQ